MYKYEVLYTKDGLRISTLRGRVVKKKKKNKIEKELCITKERKTITNSKKVGHACPSTSMKTPRASWLKSFR